jgi:hypothetical protein
VVTLKTKSGREFVITICVNELVLSEITEKKPLTYPL